MILIVLQSSGIFKSSIKNNIIIGIGRGVEIIAGFHTNQTVNFSDERGKHIDHTVNILLFLIIVFEFPKDYVLDHQIIPPIL